MCGIIATENTAGPAQRRDGQADAVDRNRAFFNDIACAALAGKFDFEIPRIAFPVEPPDAADAVDVALNNMAAESRIGSHRPLEIDDRADVARLPKCRAIKGFARQFGGKRICGERADGQADAVYRDAGAQAQIVENGLATRFESSGNRRRR